MVEATERSQEYATRPCYPELVAVVIAGAGHVVTEVAFSASIARMYNALACFFFLIYLVWRASNSKNVLRTWGMRVDNLCPALCAQLGFMVVGALFLLGYGLAARSVSIPRTFWLTLGLYPLWGTAQQFGLQNLLAKNLRELVPNGVALAFVSAILFGAAHYPRGSLVLLAFFAGFFFTLIYRGFPNLWAVGLAHGILGALALYIALGEDPFARTLQLIVR